MVYDKQSKTVSVVLSENKASDIFFFIVMTICDRTHNILYQTNETKYFYTSNIVFSFNVKVYRIT